MLHGIDELAVFAAIGLSALGSYPGRAAAPASTEKADVELAPCAGGRLDDGEDGNNQILAMGGRGGYWYTYADKAGSTIVPPAGDTGGTFSMSEGGAHR